MSIQGKKVIILCEEDFQDAELLYPKYRMKEAGADVIVAGLGDEMYTGKYGYVIYPDGNIEDYSPNDFDAIIIPGGWAPDHLRKSKEVLDCVKKMFDSNKVVAAICHAGSVLASANVLNGKQVTCYEAIKDDVMNAGAKYTDKSVVIDNNLITSRKPDDLPDFCKAILAQLER